MTAFVVRIKENHDLVGFYSADYLNELCDMVDATIDPSECEYSVLRSGGVVWSKKATAVPEHVPDIEDDDFEDWESKIPWQDASTTETWNAVYLEDAAWWPLLPP